MANRIQKVTFAGISSYGINATQTKGLDSGCFELFPKDEADEGGMSVNSRCLVIAPTLAEAQRLLDQTDPEASGCDETHLWLERGASDRVRCLTVEIELIFSGRLAAGLPVRGIGEAVEICRLRGGSAEALLMGGEIERLKGLYPDWQEQLYRAESARLACAAATAPR